MQIKNLIGREQPLDAEHLKGLCHQQQGYRREGPLAAHALNSALGIQKKPRKLGPTVFGFP